MSEPPELLREIPAADQYLALRVAAASPAMVGLIADGTAHRLYEPFGSKLVAPMAHGMLLRL